MSRPKRTSVELLCDTFTDLSLNQQDGILITLQALHRQAKRRRITPELNGGNLMLPTEEEGDLERDRR